MKVMFVGDIHGDFNYFNKILKENIVDYVIQCGDLGFFPNLNYNTNDILIPEYIKGLYFCDGNHDNHDLLHQYRSITEISSKLFYCSRGTKLNINNNNILFVGGALSLDKNQRILGRDYFTNETINEYQYSLIHSDNSKINIVVSHTCPKSFLSFLNLENIIYDQSCDYLELILERKNPSLWVFGHFHQYKEINLKNTKAYCLNRENQNNNFIIKDL